MKQRFSSLDVKVIAHELSSSLSTLRVSNIYDLSSRIFLFKFQKPEHKEQLVVDSGFRCHLTGYARETAGEPSGFVKVLRKHLRTRRVSAVRQVGTDRVIEFEFSDGLYRLFLEFYAGGNVILTDADCKVLTLLREVNEGSEDDKLRRGSTYRLDLRQNYNGVPPLTKGRLRDGLQNAVERQTAAAATAKAKTKAKKDALRKALAISITEYPPMLVDHALSVTEFDSSVKPEDVIKDEALLEKLLSALEIAGQVVTRITSAEITTGYIIAKKKRPYPEKRDEQNAAAEDESLIYEDLHPFKPHQFEKDEGIVFLEHSGFNRTADVFFSSIEGQKLESRLQEKEINAKKKVESAQAEHERRIEGLKQVQDMNVRKAQAIEANLDRVEEATAAVNGLIAQGMDWVEIARLIEMEQSRGNPVAALIKLPLKLYENTVTLKLSEPTKEDDDYEGDETESESGEDEEYTTGNGPSKISAKDDKRLAIDIDLGLSGWSNARQYYDQKRSAALKEEKTIQASAKALKSTEKKVTSDLKKALKQEKDVLRPLRPQLWFEKFYYFISSDGYLVLGGRDPQQHDTLYHRHLRKGDVYVHADLDGAAVVIVKNNSDTPNAPIPPSTLSQAGHLSVVTSSAWDSKAVMSAWWVSYDKVTKTGLTGEYLGPGKFVVKSDKNYLPPSQLLVGLAVVFQISEGSKANHARHRIQEEVDGQPEPSTEEASAADDSKERPAPAKEDSSDSDEEEFPDAKLDSNSDDSENEDHQKAQLNPLQTGVVPDADDQIQTSVSREESTVSLAVEDEDRTSSTESSTRPAGGGSKGHLSAYQRRQLKKGKDPLPPQMQSPAPSSQVASDYDLDDDDYTTTSSRQGEPPGPASITSTSVSNKPLPRGKRTKAKRLAEKYANQDPEDRELALRLLGSKGPGSTSAQAAEDKQQKPSAAEQAAAQKARRREQHLRAQAAGRAAEARRHGEQQQQQGEGGGERADEEAVDHAVDVGTFTGRPHPADDIVAALPVCAPWAALASYKYKVKLQPGTVKRGKAVREVLGRWEADGKDAKKVDRDGRDPDRIWPRERELMAGWKEESVVGIVPVGKVRVMMGGGGGGGSKGGGGGGAKGKGGGKAARGGKGSKKQR
ncbi:hypothetical protein BDY21DRAFT_320628 [Lineolata rhizophorae]|uniref:Ribosome quality control complex subunit 2 n=1 Tax=Lineolata rhizophorae TaxID=578093 RepID=A0A6A6P0A1_9PEZI|nr:hypothetical protein BDY21DRAFT_320628 [Lineolata rhizophorae]